MNIKKILAKRLIATKAHVDLVVGAFFALASAYMLFYGIKKYASVSFGSVGIVTDRFFPYIVFSVALALSVGIFVLGWFDNIRNKKLAETGGHIATTEFSILVVMMVILGVFVCYSFKTLGYPLTTIVSMISIYYMLGGKKLWQALVLSCGFALLSYLFFAVYLGVSLRLGFGL